LYPKGVFAKVVDGATILKHVRHLVNELEKGKELRTVDVNVQQDVLNLLDEFECLKPSSAMAVSKLKRLPLEKCRQDLKFKF